MKNLSPTFKSMSSAAPPKKSLLNTSTVIKGMKISNIIPPNGGYLANKFDVTMETGSAGVSGKTQASSYNQILSLEIA
jgi:hypothetical protein